MNFICVPCKNAGILILPIGSLEAEQLAKRSWHDKCPGSTWCDCQHRIGKKNI